MEGGAPPRTGSVLRFQHLTWPEVNTAAKQQRLAIIPAGTIEAHGPHLPLDTDVVIAEAICERVAARVPDDIVLMPTITIGFGPHHMDMPGNMTIGWKTLVDHTMDVLRATAYHGFNRILIVNAHGSNSLPLDMASRLMIVEQPQVQAAFLNWWSLADVKAVCRDMIESEVTSHACEVETSIYLAVAPERVQMDKAEADMGFDRSPHLWRDLLGRPPAPEGYKNPISLMEYWSTWTTNGVRGDPTKATAEKGEAILDAASAEIAEIVTELKAREILPRRDFHDDGRQPAPVRTSSEIG